MPTIVEFLLNNFLYTHQFVWLKEKMKTVELQLSLINKSLHKLFEFCSCKISFQLIVYYVH